MNALQQASERLTEHVESCRECWFVNVTDSGHLALDYGKAFDISWATGDKPHLCPVAMDILRDIFQ